MNPQILAFLGLLLIVLGVGLLDLRLMGEGGSFTFAAVALLAGGVALKMAQRTGTGY